MRHIDCLLALDALKEHFAIYVSVHQLPSHFRRIFVVDRIKKSFIGFVRARVVLGERVFVAHAKADLVRA